MAETDPDVLITDLIPTDTIHSLNGVRVREWRGITVDDQQVIVFIAAVSAVRKFYPTTVKRFEKAGLIEVAQGGDLPDLICTRR